MSQAALLALDEGQMGLFQEALVNGLSRRSGCQWTGSLKEAVVFATHCPAHDEVFDGDKELCGCFVKALVDLTMGAKAQGSVTTWGPITIQCVCPPASNVAPQYKFQLSPGSV